MCMFMNALFELCLYMCVCVCIYKRKYAVKRANIILTNHIRTHYFYQTLFAIKALFQCARI